MDFMIYPLGKSDWIAKHLHTAAALNCNRRGVPDKDAPKLAGSQVIFTDLTGIRKNF
jgi:hypothetical protein